MNDSCHISMRTHEYRLVKWWCDLDKLLGCSVWRSEVCNEVWSEVCSEVWSEVWSEVCSEVCSEI